MRAEAFGPDLVENVLPYLAKKLTGEYGVVMTLKAFMELKDISKDDFGKAFGLEKLFRTNLRVFVFAAGDKLTGIASVQWMKLMKLYIGHTAKCAERENARRLLLPAE
jgi:hypothetical protein